MVTSETAALVEKARLRDPEALGALCSSFYPKILRYMQYRVGQRFADDLAAEVFLKAIRGIGGQTGNFVAWLYRIASNVVADHARSQKMRREGPISDALTERLAGGADPAREVGRALDIQKAMGHLTDEQREMVTLKFIEGLSNAELAEITGRTADAIRHLQFRAMSSLRRILGGEEK